MSDNNKNELSGLGGFFLKMISAGGSPAGIVMEAKEESEKEQKYTGDKSGFVSSWYALSVFAYVFMMVPSFTDVISQVKPMFIIGYLIASLPVVVALFLLKDKQNEFNKSHYSNLIRIFLVSIVFVLVLSGMFFGTDMGIERDTINLHFVYTFAIIGLLWQVVCLFMYVDGLIKFKRGFRGRS